jgi:hypothetical protein
VDGLISHDSITMGGGWVAVGGGSTVGCTRVFVGITGTDVGDITGAWVLVGGKGFCVSVGVKVAICVKVREGVNDGD